MLLDKIKFCAIRFFAVAVIFSGFAVRLSALPAKKYVTQNDDGSISVFNIDDDKVSVKYNQKVDGFRNVTVIYGDKVKKQNPVTVDLSDFGGKEILVNFSCEMKIEDSTGAENDIIWMINEVSADFPKLSEEKFKSGEWKKISGSAMLSLSEKKQFYLSSFGLAKENLVFYIKNFEMKIEGDNLTGKTVELKKWLEVPSLRQAYSPYFDYFGLAVEYNEFNSPAVMEGLKYHAGSVTMGNDLKPDFLFNWKKPLSSALEDFVAEDGKTYKVPKGMPDFKNLPMILELAKDNGLKIRGHVLVWHEQTPAWFFNENYKSGAKAVLTDRDTMNARLEWYIKSVLEYVRDWEIRKNGGGHIITVWDVVNEACADNATETRWLRENSSWFKIFGDESYIVNAFRYANRYAPADVLLAYNDYGCYGGSNLSTGGKTNAVLRVIDAVQAALDARLDVVGMQSHVGINYPAVTGTDSYETALRKFLAKGVDVQVTELDIANGDRPYNSIALREKYREYFDMFLRNRKTGNQNGISGVTIWGLRDETTWLNSQKQYKGKPQFPLLFQGEDYRCKPAFFGVLDAAQNMTDRDTVK